MVNTIDMQDIRHLNLFSKVTNIDTRFCFKYNETLIYCVQKSLVNKAIGENAKNLKKINEITNKRVKVVASPRGIEDVKPFIEAIISPVKFRDIEVKDNEVIVTAGSQSKAALIGRNKRRLIEMQKIIKGFFGKDFRII